MTSICWADFRAVAPSCLDQKKAPWRSSCRSPLSTWIENSATNPALSNSDKLSTRGVLEWLSCSHSHSNTTFPFPIFSITSIPIPTAAGRGSDYIDYLKAEKYVLCREFKTKYEVTGYSRSIVNQTHHSSVIIIITITAYQCSLFNVYQTVTACYCGNFIFHL